LAFLFASIRFGPWKYLIDPADVIWSVHRYRWEITYLSKLPNISQDHQIITQRSSDMISIYSLSCPMNSTIQIIVKIITGRLITLDVDPGARTENIKM
jgi:hypothetical protein